MEPPDIDMVIVRMIQRIFLPQLPSLNDIVDMAKIRDRDGGKWSKYAQEKKKIERDLVILIKAAKVVPVTRAKFAFTWREKYPKRDPDNIAAGKKFILDALVAARILEDDGWKQVESFQDHFVVSPREAGVTVEIESV